MKTAELRCESCSPTQRFDEGPRRCRLKAGHAGNHEALTSDGRYIPHNVPDYLVRWADPTPTPPEPKPKISDQEQI